MERHQRRFNINDHDQQPLDAESIELTTRQQLFSVGEKLTSPEQLINNTETVLNLMSDLWQQRLDSMEKYTLIERNSHLKLRKTPESEIVPDGQHVMNTLQRINRHERRLLPILEHGSEEGRMIIEEIKLALLVPHDTEAQNKEAEQLGGVLEVIDTVFKTYNKVISIHREILELESEWIDSPEKKEFNLLTNRMKLLINEFEFSLTEMNSTIEDNLKKIEASIISLKEVHDRANPVQYAKVLATKIAGGTALSLSVSKCLASITLSVSQPKLTAVGLMVAVLVKVIDDHTEFSRKFAKIIDKLSS